ncbi:MAG: branched-chain amino acid ABC transporter permease, partial [Halanaerobiales bacterium]
MGKKILILFLLALAFILPLIIGTHMIHIFTTILLYMSLSLSWDMMLRTGQLSFSTAAFFGVGAYVSVITVADMGISPVLSIILGGVFAALVAYLIGFAVLKLRLIYFAIVTLALTFVFSVIIRNIPDITGGPSGKILTSSIFNGNSQKIYWLILIITVGVIAISELIRNSKIHFAINSIR